MSDRPIQEFRAGGIKAAIWENTGEKGKFYTTTFIRSYRDPNGEWKDTTVFMPDHLPKLELVTRKAYEFIQLGTRSRQTASNDDHANDNQSPGHDTAQPQQEELPAMAESESFAGRVAKGGGRRR